MKRPELLIENGDLAGQRFAVTEKGLRLGRSSSNDVHIPDEELSRNHCFFEVRGEDGLRVTDLASANGTTVNGRILGGDPADLKAGDLIEVGRVRIRIVGDTPPAASAPGSVDLGFSAKRQGAASPDGGKRRRSPLANVLWGVVALVFLVAIVVVLSDMSGGKTPQEIAAEDSRETLREFHFEQVDADSTKVFRFAMSFVNGTTLTAEVDDMPVEDRHLVKSIYLDDRAKARLEEILADADFEKLEEEYTGPDSEPPVLKSSVLKAVWSRHAKRVSCVNAVEPAAFVQLRERLEAFCKNELGIWAMGHSRAQLVALAKESAETAATKWEDRDVAPGNCHAAVRAWKESLFYLETVNPKPPEFDDYRKRLQAAEQELENRHREHRFAADRAINLEDWSTAARELRLLMELVPDRDDDRNRAAATKLVELEKKMKK